MLDRRALLLLVLALVAACTTTVAPAAPADESATTTTPAAPRDDGDKTTADAGSATPAPPICSDKSGAKGDTNLTLDVGGRKREAIVHAPPSYEPTRALPIVLVLHPLLLDHVSMRETVRLERFADQGDGFLAIFPNGVDKSWNAGECCGTAREEGVDDVGFIRALLAEVEKTYCVDSARIFAMGFSNGAFLSHRLACELDDTIRAIVPVAGTLGIPEGDCKRKAPLPVLAFHGTEDKLVPYTGGKPTGALGLLGRALDTAGIFQAPAATGNFWAKHNGAAATTIETFNKGEVTCDKHEGAAPVTLCTVTGGGHQWPGALKPFPVMGHSSNDIDATDAAITFFRDHGL